MKFSISRKRSANQIKLRKSKPEPTLRGASTAAAAAAIAGMPLVASAADELLDYNMAGEWTLTFAAGYMGLTLGLTGVAFFSYVVLTKLKII